MCKYLFLLFLCLFTAKTVLGYNCYGTIIHPLNSNPNFALYPDTVSIVINDKYYIQDDEDKSYNCTFLMDRLPFLDEAEKKVEPKCVTATMKGDLFELSMRTCIPKGECEELKGFLLGKKKPDDIDVECHECDGEDCNKDTLIFDNSAQKPLLGMSLVVVVLALLL